MKYQLLIIAHMLGASVWIGGHVVLLTVILPTARRTGEVRAIQQFELAFGPIGMLALGVQVLTGLFLASIRIGDAPISQAIKDPAMHMLGGKLLVLAIISAIAAYTSRILLPSLTNARLNRFAANAWTVTVLSILLLVFGVGIRTGGFV
jgi:putative copper export protein